MDTRIIAEELECKVRERVGRYDGMPFALSGGIDSSTLAALGKPSFVVSVQLPGDEKYNEIEHAKAVARHLSVEHAVVQLDDKEFGAGMTIAVKAIGRPIPHFNIFPLYIMYRSLSERGVTDLVLGDGPDETMFGYGRDLILYHLYTTNRIPAFQHYAPIIDKVLPPIHQAMAKITGTDEGDALMAMHGLSVEKAIPAFETTVMRKDMDDMSDGIAKHFGITNHRPYQDEPSIDNYMRDLPIEAKIHETEFGKYALRLIAEKYLPHEVAWRKKKVGGPVYPVNVLRGWTDKGEFDKTVYLDYQRIILQ